MPNLGKIATLSLTNSSSNIYGSGVNLHYGKKNVELEISRVFDTVYSEELNKFKVAGVTDLNGLFIRCFLGGLPIQCNYQIRNIVFYTGPLKRRSLLFDLSSVRKDEKKGYERQIKKSDFIGIY